MPQGVNTVNITFLGHPASHSELDGVVGSSFAFVFPLVLFVLKDLHSLCQRHFGPHLYGGLLQGHAVEQADISMFDYRRNDC